MKNWKPLKHPLPEKPSKVCGCRACGEVFNSLSAFDRHRIGKYPNKQCLTAEELTEKGWKQNTKGYWRQPKRTVWRPQVAQDSTNAPDPVG